eukprot:TRINITY_DN3761_c0_g1_i1.p1 TRINITY_DN3761_c0_g1~~TRINITY_DN3761_c0_g1_i1.p1  ORF type:complete len:221 (+),score=36.36 TRINITY_DN3761_c0_g1_i1:37-663(+)
MEQLDDDIVWLIVDHLTIEEVYQLDMTCKFWNKKLLGTSTEDEDNKNTCVWTKLIRSNFPCVHVEIQPGYQPKIALKSLVNTLPSTKWHIVHLGNYWRRRTDSTAKSLEYTYLESVCWGEWEANRKVSSTGEHNVLIRMYLDRGDLITRVSDPTIRIRVNNVEVSVVLLKEIADLSGSVGKGNHYRFLLLLLICSCSCYYDVVPDDRK